MRRIIAFLTAILLCAAPAFACADETVAPDTPQKNASLRLISQLYKGQNVLVFSPLSLTIALDMASEGANGETKSQLDEFLGSKRPDQMLLEDFSFSGVELANAAFLPPALRFCPNMRQPCPRNTELRPF